MNATFFASGDALREWLDANHGHATELLVGFYKKSARKAGISYPEALDAALAFGWIDGVRRGVDEERWTIRFTPRQARSVWSAVNIKRVRQLLAEGRMAPAGVRAFEARVSRRGGTYSYERANATLDPALARRFRANARAKTFFDRQPPGYRKVVLHWVTSAKKEETKARRLARVIEKSERGERIDFMKPQS